jgi:hemolysin III
MQFSSGTTTVAWNYDRTEIVADGVIHALGVALGVAGAVVLLTVTSHAAHGSTMGPVIVYLVGLLAMLGTSAVYNIWPVSSFKWMLRRFDHSVIYLLIAATYTPFLLHIKSGAISATLLVSVWSIAVFGMALKLLWPGRLERLSIALYLLLGWSGALAYQSLVASLGPLTLWLIAIGGALYSVGVLFHIWERLRFHTVIWHSFVLIAACCHYMAVLSCVTTAV